jgi:hypothetical protein
VDENAGRCDLRLEKMQEYEVDVQGFEMGSEVELG